MNKMLFIATLAVALTTLSACTKEMTKTDTAAATASTVAASDQDAYEAALAAAKAEIKKASAVGGEWRDTGKILKKAEKAAADGNYDTATKMAEKARFQAIKGQEQAASQVNVGNPAYLY
mgnify:FL=1